MKFLIIISDLMIPLVLVYILFYGYSKKIDVYEAFCSGAKDGLSIVVKIIPTLIGLMVSVGVLRASGALDLLSNLISPFTEPLGYPKEAVPLTFMRLISSSASTGILLDLFKNYGPDSFLGRFVSVMMSSTETVFYTMSVYFMAVKITKTKYTLAGALISNFAGVLASLIITYIIWG